MVAIVSIGEALVEVMRTERDCPLDRPGGLMGPFPSGAPAIFANAAGALATTRMGPMEGTFSRTQVLDFMASQGRPL